MNETPLVIVGIDGSAEAVLAVEEAADEAALLGAELEVVHVWEWFSHEGRDWYGRALRDHAERLVHDAADRARIRQPRISVRATLLDDTPVVALIEASKHARLLVLGSRGLGGFAGLLLGSVSLGVSARSQCPVLVVSKPSVPSRPVLVGVSGEDSRPAIEAAFEEARRRHTSLVALHAWAFPDIPSSLLSRHDPESPHHRAQEFARHVLANAMSPVRERHPDVAVEEVVVRAGRAAALVQAAETSALVVLAAHRRAYPIGARLGPTTHAVLHHSPVPILVVPVQP
ncbi:universal stress protein (plasmid) [Embleya sp. NBC_00888]|uniref:universal stress protein n=1 Tax=Embleya sp. NBC_00888 TaxID=2975960 RepID=UPI002F911E98|nr:universal stress protein [Embleya sp. NBC_00888]